MEDFYHCQIGGIIYLGLCKKQRVRGQHTPFFLALSVLHKTSGEEEMKRGFDNRETRLIRQEVPRERSPTRMLLIVDWV